MKITSAYANKLLKQLNEEKDYWENMEINSRTYTAAVGEVPVIPAYDYVDVSHKLAEIDEKVVRLKHAINMANVNSTVMIGEKEMSIDAVLVKMAQLNNRKVTLDAMRKHLPKVRINNGCFGGRVTQQPEYEYVNYDLDTVKKDFERINLEIMEMQIALDKHNQTFEFEVEL